MAPLGGVVMRAAERNDEQEGREQVAHQHMMRSCSRPRNVRSRFAATRRGALPKRSPSGRGETGESRKSGAPTQIDRLPMLRMRPVDAEELQLHPVLAEVAIDPSAGIALLEDVRDRRQVHQM